MRAELQVIEDSNLFYLGKFFKTEDGDVAYLHDFDGEYFFYTCDKLKSTCFSTREEAEKELNLIKNPKNKT